MNSQQVNSFGR